MDRNTLVVVAVAAGVVLLLLLVLWAVRVRAARARRAEEDRLRGRFGPEYDRTLAATGDRRRTAAELAEREHRHEALQLRALTPAERERYGDSWRRIEAGFLERPALAVGEADRIVLDLLRDRGYPAPDADSAAADLSVEDAPLVTRYRQARDVVASGSGDVEGLRRSMLDYRAVVRQLLAEGEAPADASVAPAAATGRPGADGGTGGPDLRDRTVDARSDEERRAGARAVAASRQPGPEAAPVRGAGPEALAPPSGPRVPPAVAPPAPGPGATRVGGDPRDDDAGPRR